MSSNSHGEVSGQSSKGFQATLYAMIGTLPDRQMAREMVLQYFNDLYSLK